MEKRARGFTLVELLVVIAIIGILVVAVMVVMNPMEMLRKSRDTTRLSDLNNLQQAINIAVQESSKSGNEVLCVGGGACTGDTYPLGAGTRANDGSGWVKVNLASQNSVSMPTLPVDPTNNSTLHYTYKSDGKDWEIDAVLESDVYVNQQQKMINDGGDNPGVYEVGSNLKLIN